MLERFPGVRDGWARFDGPAGTQMVDTAIAAMADWAASGNNANSGGTFSASDACDALLERTRGTVAMLLGASAAGICFGANMTTLTFAFHDESSLAQSRLPSCRVAQASVGEKPARPKFVGACSLAPPGCSGLAPGFE